MNPDCIVCDEYERKLRGTSDMNAWCQIFTGYREHQEAMHKIEGLNDK